MSYEESLRSITLLADSSLAGYTGVPGTPGAADPNYGKALYRIVKLTGKNTVGVTTADEDLSIGICQNKPQVTGQAATVAIRGVSNVIAGENNITAGMELSSDNEGRAIAAVQGKVVIGIALAPSSAVGEQIPVLIRPGVKA